MVLKDKRIKYMNEILRGIKVIRQSFLKENNNVNNGRSINIPDA